MLSNHGLPYVGRFACDWHRLSTTDPHTAMIERTAAGHGTRSDIRFGGVRAALQEPAWLWIGGVMSVFIVLAITVGPPRIGVTATVATVIAGNLVSAAIIDRLGLFGVSRVGLAWPRVLGFVLLALGAGLTLKR